MRKGILAVLSGLAGAITAGTLIGRLEMKNTEKQKEFADKHLVIIKDMNQWLILKQKGIILKPFFTERGYQKVAIYGMSFLGERLYDDLKEIGVETAYGIDKNAARIYSEIDVWTPDEELESVDAIIVTSAYYFGEIEDVLKKKVSCDIVSLEDILYEVDN